MWNTVGRNRLSPVSWRYCVSPRVTFESGMVVRSELLRSQNILLNVRKEPR